MATLAINGGKPVRSEPYPAWPVVSDADVAAVAEVVRSGKWGRLSGPQAQDFERAFATYQEAKFCLAVNSGTSALEIGLQALNLNPGDEVILCPYTFFASATAILLSGLVPIFVDMDPDTFNIDPDKIEPAISKRTAAIMPVHFGGLACDMQRIIAIAKKRGLKIIEDAAHAHGAKWNGRALGAVGDVGAFSFQGSKNLNSGEGGAVVTNDREIYERCIDLHDVWTGGLGQRQGDSGGGSMRAGPRWNFPYACHNFRLSTIHAVLLHSQLQRLEEQTESRTTNGRYLIGLIDAAKGIQNLRRDPYVTRDSHHLFIFKYKKEAFGGLPREKFADALKAEGIPASLGYPRGCHQQPLFQNDRGSLARVWPRDPGGKVDVDYQSMYCPNVDYLCENETIWLPQSLLLDTRRGMDQVIEAVGKVRDGVAELIGAEVSA